MIASILHTILHWLHLRPAAPDKEIIRQDLEEAEALAARSREVREDIRETAARLIRDSAQEATRQRSIRATYAGETGNWVETEIFGGYPSAERDRG